MNLVEMYQNEVYALAFSLTNDEKKSRILAFNTFDEIVPKSYGSFRKIKFKLFKNLLEMADRVSIKSPKTKNFVWTFKRRLSVFDRKVFVLKFDFDLSSLDIAIILGVSRDKVKKSLLDSMDEVARKMEDLS
jgi:hypothetical protein